MKLSLVFILALIAWIGWRAWYTGALPVQGSKAPDFSLPDQNGNIQMSASYSGRWLILYFYPKDDTPGCTKEACAFRDGWQKLHATGVSVVGISVDSQASHHRFAGKYKLPFPLLADVDGAVARRYGVLMDWVVLRTAKRTTFLIDPKGIIHKIYPNVDLNQHVDQVLSDIR